jgi:hypothetical protein
LQLRFCPAPFVRVQKGWSKDINQPSRPSSTI